MTRLRSLLRRFRHEPAGPSSEIASQGLDPSDQVIVERALPFTMTGPARLTALVDATRHCIERGIPGALVECGVWRGGSVLAMILTLQDQGVNDRDIYLYDTFEGMTAPTKDDVSEYEGSALQTWIEAERRGERAWPEMFGSDVFNENVVRDLILSTGYSSERLHLIKGPVEETLPGGAPEQIALLRLDTDWYESTRHELEHLYPQLSGGGVLIIDDYGHWKGARRAVDEYFSGRNAPLLSRVDYTGRIGVKDSTPSAPRLAADE